MCICQKMENFMTKFTQIIHVHAYKYPAYYTYLTEKNLLGSERRFRGIRMVFIVLDDEITFENELLGHGILKASELNNTKPAD